MSNQLPLPFKKHKNPHYHNPITSPNNLNIHINNNTNFNNRTSSKSTHSASHNHSKHKPSLPNFFFLQLISTTLSKHKTSPIQYAITCINNLVDAKTSHAIAVYKEKLLERCSEEFLRREYNINECIERIPKFVNYYKNYLLFFCKPIFREFNYNYIIQAHGEAKAEIYYIETYGKDEKEDEIKKIFTRKVFSDSIKHDIEQCNGDNNTLSFSVIDIKNQSIPTKQNSIRNLLVIMKKDKKGKGGECVVVDIKEKEGNDKKKKQRHQKRISEYKHVTKLVNNKKNINLQLSEKIRKTLSYNNKNNRTNSNTNTNNNNNNNKQTTNLENQKKKLLIITNNKKNNNNNNFICSPRITKAISYRPCNTVITDKPPSHPILTLKRKIDFNYEHKSRNIKPTAISNYYTQLPTYRNKHTIQSSNTFTITKRNVSCVKHNVSNHKHTLSNASNINKRSKSKTNKKSRNRNGSINNKNNKERNTTTNKIINAKTIGIVSKKNNVIPLNIVVPLRMKSKPKYNKETTINQNQNVFKHLLNKNSFKTKK